LTQLGPELAVAVGVGVGAGVLAASSTVSLDRCATSQCSDKLNV